MKLKQEGKRIIIKRKAEIQKRVTQQIAKITQQIIQHATTQSENMGITELIRVFRAKNDEFEGKAITKLIKGF